MNPSRRSLLAAAGGAFATVAPGLRVAFAADAPVGTVTKSVSDILIVMFMRGGQDGLQLVAPAGESEYIQNRPRIAVATNGPNAGLGVGTLDGVDMYFHPALSDLKGIYDAGHLAVVQAVGVPTIDRSHFVVQDLMEQGLADSEIPKGATGWLARHLASRGGAQTALGTIASANVAPVSLSGNAGVVAITDPAYFNLYGGSSVAQSIRRVNGGAGVYQVAVRSLVDAVSTVQDRLATMRAQAPAAVVDNSNDLNPYPYSAFGDALRSLATLIKMDVGLETATVDMSGWDLHAYLAGPFNQLAAELSQSLTAFWNDIAAYRSRVTIVTMTEFGRRFTENSDRGLDHGAAGAMLVLGGNVAGGRIYGHWPGLSDTALDNNSLRVTTDYRQVLAELIVKRHSERNLAKVFPELSYAPLGVVAAG